MKEWIKKAIGDAWSWLMAWTQVLDNANGKFSHKRLMALAFTAVAIYLVIKPRGWLDLLVAAGFVAAAVILGIVSAVTKT